MTLRPVSLALLAASFLTTAPAFFSAASQATDLDVSAAEENGDGDARLVRIGLNKSIVIKLPADARDVIVGNEEIVDAVVRTKNVAYLFARNVGQTNIFFFDANGQQILALDLEVSLDSLAIKKLLRRSLPGTRITVDTADRNVVLGGFASNAQEAKIAEDLATQFTGDPKKVVNTIKIAGEDQVMLKVKVVEIQRDVLKQMGVDLQAVLSAGQAVFNVATINPFSLALPISAGGATATDNIGSTKFDSLIRAMESDGLSRSLAEPNLTAVSGKPAKFHAGGEFGYPGRDKDGNTTTMFKPFGVNLDFTPTVVGDGRINLKIRSEVSELSGQFVNGVPSISNNSTDTTLELPSGGSMMIAGLIKETTRQNINGTPGLKKLPVLGALFRSREFQANETELVIIVTPYLVNPVAQKQLVTPDKNFNPPSERQALFWGKMHKTYGANGKAPDGNYNGNVGFIVE
jgi:pilus assembly protein CpaC